VEPADVRM